MAASVHVVKGQLRSGLETLKLILYEKALRDFFKKKYGNVILQLEKHFGIALCG
jgi:hypothetical protein